MNCLAQGEQLYSFNIWVLWEPDIPFPQLMFPGAVQPLDCHNESIQQPIENTVRVSLALHAQGALVVDSFLEEWRLHVCALTGFIPNYLAWPVLNIHVLLHSWKSSAIINNRKHSYHNCNARAQHLQQNSPAWCCKLEWTLLSQFKGGKPNIKTLL